MKVRVSRITLAILTASLAWFSGPSCGVKGPPLPPVPTTPQQSEPAASPSPAPKPTAAENSRT